MSKFTVWVGGAEVNDNYLNEVEAFILARDYRNNGFDDVFIEVIDLVDTINSHKELNKSFFKSIVDRMK